MDRHGSYWMWAQACELLDRADRVQRRFFEPGHGPTTRVVSWEPPVDVFELPGGVWIVAALPGVPAERIELFIDGADLIVTGQRTLPSEVRGGTVQRLEIPTGRFERRIALPPGQFELVERRHADGCLHLGLRRRGL